jgi:hypothetical protein
MTTEELCRNIWARMVEIDGDITKSLYNPTLPGDNPDRPPEGDDYNLLWDAQLDEMRQAGFAFKTEDASKAEVAVHGTPVAPKKEAAGDHGSRRRNWRASPSGARSAVYRHGRGVHGNGARKICWPPRRSRCHRASRRSASAHYHRNRRAHLSRAHPV